MRVVSWNIHRCLGMDGMYSPRRVATLLEQLQPDVVALQEVDSSLRVPDGRDQLTYIAEILKMNCAMGPAFAHDYGAYGNAVLSRYSLTTQRELDLSYRRYEPRGAIEVTIDLPSGRASFWNTHLGLGYLERFDQISRLATLIDFQSGSPIFLTGDFNEWLSRFFFLPNERKLRKHFGRVQFLPTFPARSPRFALDRIFFSASTSSDKWTVPTLASFRTASDHLPLIYDCYLAQE
jgi:endonuclease/exonuclease/phosphatase family metal-dependent hydrolase